MYSFKQDNSNFKVNTERLTYLVNLVDHRKTYKEKIMSHLINAKIIFKGFGVTFFILSTISMWLEGSNLHIIILNKMKHFNFGNSKL